MRLILRDQGRIYRAEQCAIHELARNSRRADPAWIMPDKLMARLSLIDNWMLRAPSAAQKNQEILDAELANVPAEQLEATVRRELLELVTEWSDEHWAIVDAARAKKQPGRWVPAREAA